MFSKGLYVWLFILALPFTFASAPTQEEGTYDEKVRTLLEIVGDTSLQQTAPDRVIQAIQELGRLKAKEGAQSLVKLLAFKRTWPGEHSADGTITEIHTLTPASRYPAVGALMEIGKGSLPALLKAIETHESSSLETENAMEVILYLSRDEASEMYDRLKAAAAKASTTEGSERLLKAANTLRERTP